MMKFSKNPVCFPDYNHSILGIPNSVLKYYGAKPHCSTLAVWETHTDFRADWQEVKLDIMANLVWQKFNNSAKLRQMLLATGDAVLEEGNDWGDTFWGVCNGVGENHLGKILMRTRENLRQK